MNKKTSRSTKMNKLISNCEYESVYNIFVTFYLKLDYLSFTVVVVFF